MKRQDRKNKNTFTRLTKIKAFIELNDCTSMLPIQHTIKGSSMLYTLLSRKGILYKNDDYVWCWKEDVTITLELAMELTAELTNVNIEYIQRQLLPTSEEDIVPSNEPFKLSRSRAIESIKQSSFTVSILWGLFTYKRDSLI